MTFERYLKKNYVVACEMQCQIVSDGKIVKSLRENSTNLQLVKSWMVSYNLFQGINTAQRDAIANGFLQFSRNYKSSNRQLTSTDIEEQFGELLLALYRIVNRSWLSATSKLLWCIYPDQVVLYDSFVYRSLTVFQCVDADLTAFPRIGSPPKFDSEASINKAVQHYMGFQNLVKHLQQVHQPALDRLREKNKETCSYEYDIRIIDKLLWMIGNANYEH